MGVHPVGQHFDVVVKVQRKAAQVKLKPESALRELLRIARIYGSRKCNRSESERKAALAALSDVAGSIQEAVIATFPDNFQVNWLTARVMHRIGKNKDALSFLHAAEALNQTTRGVPFRKAEVLADMHAEIPSNGYGREAFGIAVTATWKHPSLRNIIFTGRVGIRALNII